jgi:hypothetical protein
MNKIIFIVFILFLTFKISYGQDNHLVIGSIDSLGNKVGFHIQFLDSRFLACDSSEASFKHYVYYIDGKPLKHYSLLPKFIKNYILTQSILKEDNDSILLVDGKYSFFHRKKTDSLEFIYKNGFLIYEKFVKALNKPTIYIPSFKVTLNYEYYIEERFYNKRHKNYFPSYYYESYILAKNMLKNDHQKLSIYFEDNKWKQSAFVESE